MNNKYQQMEFPNIDVLIREANPHTASETESHHPCEWETEEYYEYVDATALEVDGVLELA